MSVITIKANNTTLPSPVEISTGDETIWSSNTGRSTTGKMIGDVVSEKKTFEIEWGVLTRAQFNTIRNNLAAGFHPFTIIIDGTSTEITSYRGTLSGKLLGTFGGTTYYKSASVSVIQQ